jgi:hypothetical protein
MPALAPTADAIAADRVGTSQVTGKLLYGFDHCVQIDLTLNTRIRSRQTAARVIWNAAREAGRRDPQSPERSEADCRSITSPRQT